MKPQRASGYDRITRRRLLAGGVASLVVAAGGVQAQSFPSGPVKIIVSVGPGGSPDVLARIVADHLTRLWGQQVIVFNQPGAAGAIAIRATAAAPADGHTLYMSLATNYIALPELQQSLQFDVARDFVPIGFVGAHPMVIAARDDLGVTTLPQLIALAQKRKGELNIAAGNRGSILHLSGEWLRAETGIDVQLLHYAAASQAITDVLGGRVHAMIDAVTSMRGAIDSGKLKPLAIATKQRQPRYPDLPTFAETIPGFEALGWLALIAPPGTPEPVARKISDDLRTVLARDELKQRFDELGTSINPTTPAELTAFVREQIQIWRPVIAKTAKTMR
jgi:tripartite-type tricarboxylate transporter receptor subunit TctC